ncbi:uncharacterized protein [Primulina huaijiensis]|uniref:uncharacterized protein n=1 Tax=Primulina huaijiensis TaxID=1492673 RepID=UPI003CC72ADD
MDFVTGLPRTIGRYNVIWVIVDRFTKSGQFLPIKKTFTMTQHVELYIREIVRFHGIPVSIVSDRDPRFTSAFWKSLLRALGTKLLFSTALHSQTDGQSERVIRILEDLLRACVINFQDSWELKLPLAKNARISQLSLQRPLQTEIKIFELAVYAMGEALSISTLTVQSRLRDRKVKAEHQRPVGKLRPLPILEWKWENISTMDFMTGLPKTIGRYNVIWLTPNLCFEERPTQILDRQERTLRNKVIQMVKVKWLNYSEEEATCETKAEMRSRYPELFGSFNFEKEIRFKGEDL